MSTALAALLPACVDPGEPVLGTVDQEVFGTPSYDSSCSNGERAWLDRALYYGRVAVRSEAFRQCLDTGMATGLQVNLWGIGPYVGCDGDPADLSSNTVFAVAHKHNDLEFACGENLGPNTLASTSWWDVHDLLHNETEEMSFGGWLRSIATQPMDDTTLAKLAGIIWHEVMHTHGYGHGSNNSNADALDSCEPRPLPAGAAPWHYQNNTIPYIVERCVQKVLEESDKVCEDLTTGCEGGLWIANRAGGNIIPDGTQEGTVVAGASRVNSCTCVRDSDASYMIAGGAPALVQGAHGSPGNFELVVPDGWNDLHHYYRDNSDNPALWRDGGTFGGNLGKVEAAAMIVERASKGLEVIARVGDKLFHIARGNDFRWGAPLLIGGNATGNPALIQSNYGPDGNFELVAPAASGGGFVHYWRDMSAPGKPWRAGAQFARDLGAVGAVSMILHGNNFELVARVGERLVHYYSDAPGAWYRTDFFGEGLAGVPSFTTDRWGTFQVVAPAAGRGAVHFWRDQNTNRWGRVTVLGEDLGRVDAATLMRSSSGNLELVLRRGEELATSWFDGSWHGTPMITGLHGTKAGNLGGIGRSGWFDIGGGATLTRAQDTRPVGVVRYPHHVDVFAMAPSGQLMTTWWNPYVNGARFAGWRPIGNKTFLAWSQPAAVARTRDHLDVFVTGDDGRVFTSWWFPGMPDLATFAPIPGELFPSGTPVTAHSRHADHLQLFAVASDGRIHTNEWAPATSWQGWRPVGEQQFPLWTPVTAVARDPGIVDLFAVAYDGRVKHVGWTVWTQWLGWHDIGTRTFARYTSIAAISDRTDRTQLAAVDSNGAPVWTLWQPGVDWPEWRPLGAAVFPPGAPLTGTSTRIGHVDLFGVADDGTVKSIYLDNGGGPSRDWFPISGPGQSFPRAAPLAPARHRMFLDVLAIGADGRMRATQWDGDRWR